ncbi:MAG: adenylate/guanylate cyclase domain-containing protein [Desulfobacterales bacterium]
MTKKTDQIARKLAAILSTDVKDYSRLMGDDEMATVETITRYRSFISEFVESHHGRVVDSPGDNLLAEFASAVEALDCAVAIQEKLATENQALEDHRRMEFRIGINVGDVISQGDRLYGDGVNIAARLEGLSDAGGICISGTVYDQISNKTGLPFDFIGSRQVKNIAKPVRVYKVLLSKEAERANDVSVAEASTIEDKADNEQPSGSTRLQLPDKPSIAVLPLVNLGQGTDQDYFSDGLTEDIITDLSKISGIFVIAKNSAFAYKGRSVLPPQVSRELGVRHILEGTVRRAGQRMRIATQLVDAPLNQNIWADRFDGNLEDIFELQDQVTGKVVSALKVKLTSREKEQRTNRSSVNPKAYDLVKKANKLGLESTFKSHLEAREIYQRAVDLDPGYAPAYVGLGWTWFDEWPFGWSEDRMVLEKALHFAQKAVDLDPTLPEASLLMGYTYLWLGEYEKAEDVNNRLLAIAPNNADALAFFGYLLTFSGRAEEAVAPLIRAKRLDPGRHVRLSMYLAFVYNMLERYEEAVAELEPYLDDYPLYFPLHRVLVYAYWQAGDLKRARQMAAHVMQSEPDWSSEAFGRKWPFKDESMRNRFIDTLKKAGFS